MPRISANTVTLEEHFNSLCLKVLEKPEANLLDKLDDLTEHLRTINTDIDALLKAKEKELNIQTQISHALTLIQAIEENDNNVVSIKYALALIESQQESFDSLFANASLAEKEEWTMRMDQLKSPGFKIALKNAVEYTFSWATYIPTIAFRALAPGFIKETLNPILPKTFDSECKAALKTMALSRLTALQQSLNTSKADIDGLSATLAGSNSTNKPLLLNASSHALTEIKNKNSTIVAVLGDFKTLSSTIIAEREKLKRVEEIAPLLNAYLETHDTFFRWVMRLLAKLFSVFNTRPTMMVEDAITMRAELRELKHVYVASIKNDEEKIRLNPNVSNAIKEKICGELAPKTEGDDALQPTEAPKFELVATMFRGIKPASKLASIDTAPKPRGP